MASECESSSVTNDERVDYSGEVGNFGGRDSWISICTAWTIKGCANVT
jgi:hypothetical protein